MNFLGGKEKESGGLLELILLCLGVLSLVGGAFEVFLSIAEDVGIASGERRDALGRLRQKEHSVALGMSSMVGSVVFFWMKRVLDLLGK